MWKKILWCCLILLLFLFCTTVLLVFSHNNFNLSLDGDKVYTINLGEVFIEPGFKCTILDYDLKDKIDIKTNLNINKIGEYKIEYAINFLGINYEVSRVVNVIDSIIPEISLNGDANISLDVGSNYNELGATATDNYDGDLSNQISIYSNIDINTPGTYTVVYTVKDSSGNENSTTREIEIKKKVVRNNYSSSINNTILSKEFITSNDITTYIKNNNYRVSIGYYNLIDGSSFYYNANKVYYGASLIKTLDALYLYENNMVTDDIKVHINRAISVSNNESHKYLVNYIGKDNLKAYGVALGAINTLAGRDYYGNTTVNDQIIYMKKLYEITKDGNNSELKSFFINNYANFLKCNDINVMHKYGYYNQYFHESGIFLTDEPYILVVLTEHGNNSYSSIINNISKLIYKFHINN